MRRTAVVLRRLLCQRRPPVVELAGARYPLCRLREGEAERSRVLTSSVVLRCLPEFTHRSMRLLVVARLVGLRAGAAR